MRGSLVLLTNQFIRLREKMSGLAPVAMPQMSGCPMSRPVQLKNILSNDTTIDTLHQKDPEVS